MPDKTKEQEEQEKYGGQNDRWPGEAPLPPKPGTTTPGPGPGEETHVPVVR